MTILFALIKDVKDISMCWKYRGKFERDKYHTCLSIADSLTIIKDSSNSFGVF